MSATMSKIAFRRRGVKGGLQGEESVSHQGQGVSFVAVRNFNGWLAHIASGSLYIVSGTLRIASAAQVQIWVP